MHFLRWGVCGGEEGLEGLGLWCSHFPKWLNGKESVCPGRRHTFDPWVREIPLEKDMAPHSSILASRIPWTEEPGRQPMVLQSQTWLSD